MATADYNAIRKAYIIVLLCIAVVLIPIYAIWAARQERNNGQDRRQRPVLIANGLWRKSSFTATCVIVFFTWAAFNYAEFRKQHYSEKR
jgi:ABC-type Fe3+ transport system permease subunit